MNAPPAFDELADLIRSLSCLRADQHIDPDSQFERDLGITGDDGNELLEGVEKQYGVEFSFDSFGLEPNEYLFNSEGWDLFNVPIRILLRKPEPQIRSFTAGQLYEGLLRELNRPSDN